MTLWDGSHWVDETPASSPTKPSRLHNWAATLLMVLSLAAIAVPIQLVAAQSGPTISVWWGTSTTPTATLSGDSHFTAGGCGFRANDENYYLVVHGPAPGTASLAYWVDGFRVGGDGCGSATPSWASSGVTGTFDVYVVRSASGNPWQARPVTNIVEVNITTL
jgi:hypothetical protein